MSVRRGHRKSRFGVVSGQVFMKAEAEGVRRRAGRPVGQSAIDAIERLDARCAPPRLRSRESPSEAGLRR